MTARGSFALGDHLYGACAKKPDWTKSLGIKLVDPIGSSRGRHGKKQRKVGDFSLFEVTFCLARILAFFCAKYL